MPKKLKETTSMLIEKMEYTIYQEFIQECKERDWERGQFFQLIYNTYQEYKQMVSDKNALLDRVAKKNKELVKDAKYWQEKYETLLKESKSKNIVVLKNDFKEI